ncbi:MAG: phospholipid carrier-dependent glycosyltransferase [Planctomycetaceae bacterium]
MTRFLRKPAAGPALVAALSLLAVLATLDGVGELPNLPQGPGLTLDEVFNIHAGVSLARGLMVDGFGLLDPARRAQLFDGPGYNPDHPPLGRLAIGATHDLTVTIVPALKPGQRGYSLVAARVAPAIAFSLTVLLVGWAAGRWYGATAAAVAAITLATVPRVFAHGHLASLESFIGLTFTATVLGIAEWWVRRPEHESPTTRSLPLPPWRAVTLAGALLGLTLLTKIQAVLIPLPVGAWALWTFGPRCLSRLVVFGLVGVTVFLVGWPWLWEAPVERTLQYLGRGVDRPTLYCFYLGTRYADIDVPWHYPFLMTLLTLPIGTLGLITCGLWSRRGRANSLLRDPRSTLLATVILFVLTFFALPGITNYDGARLFLVVFPLLSLLAGRGAALIIHRPSAMPRSDHEPRPLPNNESPATTVSTALPRPRVAVAVVATLLIQSIRLFALHPCQLSHYSLLAGGLAGANQLGLEPTYWRDSFTRDFLQQVADEVPANATLYVAPLLHPLNQSDLPLLSPILQRQRLTFAPYDHNAPYAAEMRYVLVYRRRADPWSSLEPPPEGSRMIAEVVRAGVQLAACYELPQRR